jgi:virginiamycin B lyase
VNSLQHAVAGSCAGILGTLLVAGPASAATLSGVVRDPSGRPAANVFVTLQDDSRKMAQSVLTDAKGQYRVVDLFAAEYQVHARRSGFNDSEISKLQLSERDARLDLALQPDDAAHLNTPGSAWLNPLPNEPMKATFISSCTICHDSASPLAHTPRDAAGWVQIIHQMRSQADTYSVIVKMEPEQLASWLAKNAYGTRIAPYDPFAKAANVVTDVSYTQYQVGDATSWAHDLAVEPRTGNVYVGDYVRDELILINPRTGEQKVYKAPIRMTGMHTLNFDKDDGALWITFQLVAMVARFEPRTGEWRLYSGFTPGSLNHSFAIDSEGFVKKDPQGRLYLGLWGGNRTGMLDPKTGAVTEKQLPGPASDKPYGIVVNSKGVVWYTKYSENKIGYYDPNSGEMKEWALPRPDSAPHRMQIDNSDRLWIPLSGYGTMLRYDTRTGEQHEFPLPDKDAFPYASRYDAKSNRVWITGNGGNAIYAMHPETGAVQTFRMPDRYSYGRMVTIDYSTGDVWTALASYPNKLALRDHSIVVRIHHALDRVK